MYINIAVLKETRPNEKRVAIVPPVMSKLAKMGGKLHIQTQAGSTANFPDESYGNCVFMEDPKQLVHDADVVLAVQAPSAELVNSMQDGSILISFIYEEREQALVQRLLEKRITCFAMERVPRITRAQSLDALSSQAALTGYYAVQLGATNLGRILPKITTAAGTIGPARVLVMGLGVAGLEALATAKRLGADVEGYDVRPATEEQALSLGAKFVQTGVDATGGGGYARGLTAEEQLKIASTLTQHIQSADLIITTAAIPGKSSPKLIDSSQLSGMKRGSVVVDLSAEGGGNCVDTKPGETIIVNQITIVAPLNVPSLLAEDASKLYSNNLFNLLALMMKENVIQLDWSDEVISKTALTHDGKLTDSSNKSAA